MTAPVIVHLVLTTEGRGPEEPTSPVMVESVQVTAPPAPGAALKTAKLDAAPNDGGAGASANAGKAPTTSAAIADKHTDRYFWR